MIKKIIGIKIPSATPVAQWMYNYDDCGIVDNKRSFISKSGDTIDESELTAVALESGCEYELIYSPAQAQWGHDPWGEEIPGPLDLPDYRN